MNLKYPSTPGHKGDVETGRQAAGDIASEAASLRARCLEALALGDYTADEIAAKIGRDILSVRPRISELRRLGKIEASPLRRANSSGKRAAVWRRKEGV